MSTNLYIITKFPLTKQISFPLFLSANPQASDLGQGIDAASLSDFWRGADLRTFQFVCARARKLHGKCF